MTTLKARLLGGWIGDRLLRDTLVESVTSLGPSFRHITLCASWLEQHTVRAGDKVQIFVPGVGARTYTPFGHDRAAGCLSLVAHLHGASPGTEWARRLQPGVTVRLIGPSRSTPLTSLAGPVALFGDETSLAVARALVEAKGRETSLVRLESRTPGATRLAASALGLAPESVVEQLPDDGHLAEIARVFAEASTHGGAMVLTGRAPSIQRLRVSLRPLAKGRPQLVRAYWAPGKVGLE